MKLLPLETPTTPTHNSSCVDSPPDSRGSQLGRIMGQASKWVTPGFELIRLTDVTPEFGPVEDPFGYLFSKPRFTPARLYAMHLIDFVRDLRVCRAEQSLSELIYDVADHDSANPHLASLTTVQLSDRDIHVVYTGELKAIQRMRRAFHKSSRPWVMHGEASRKVYCGMRLTSFEESQDVRAYVHYLTYCRLIGRTPLSPEEWNNKRGRR